VTAATPISDGFVIGGSAPKTVLLRAVGPGLGAFGVTGYLASPALQLFNSSGQVLLSKTAWDGSSVLSQIFARLGAFPLAQGSADAAVVTTLAPGAYTIRVSSGNGADGTALAEVYDADINPLALSQRLINLSGFGLVNGGNIVTGGFVINGSAPKTVLVRGVGPALVSFGVSNALASPLLSLYGSNGTLLAQNAGWGNPVTVNAGYPAASASAIAAAAASAGAFALPSDSADAAIIVTLPPGAYTGQVSGANLQTGTALFEVYELP
jgi:hypothetical protein